MLNMNSNVFLPAKIVHTINLKVIEIELIHNDDVRDEGGLVEVREYGEEERVDFGMGEGGEDCGEGRGGGENGDCKGEGGSFEDYLK